MDRIDAYRLALDPAEGESWTGTITVTLDRYDLKTIRDSLSSAHYEGVIEIEEANRMLDKLNLERLW